MIDRRKLLAIRFRLLLVLDLRACGGYMTSALSRHLRCCRLWPQFRPDLRCS